LRVKERQLLNRVTTAAVEIGTTDRDMALLYLAHQNELDVTKPRFAVPRDKLARFEALLKRRDAQIARILPTPSATKGSKVTKAQTRHLLEFKGEYPEIFYDRLEDEINTAYSNPALPNAVLMLSRKLIENLVYNLLEYRFGGREIDVYYDTKNRRARDFGDLLDNLKERKSKFDLDHHALIDKFLDMAHPFRRDANSKTHKVIEYLESMREIKKFKIPEMTQILLKLTNRVKNGKSAIHSARR
jgi:hypothetical protein